MIVPEEGCMVVEIKIGTETMIETGTVITDMVAATLGRVETETMSVIVIDLGAIRDETGTDLATLDGIIEIVGMIGASIGTGERTEIGEMTEIEEMIEIGGLLTDGMIATEDRLTGAMTGLERALRQGGRTL